MTSGALHDLYEDPTTPLYVGAEPARYQGEMLAALACKAGGSLRVLDLGCGDGSTALAVLAACSANGSNVRIVGVDWSSVALQRARRNGFAVARASVESPGLPVADASVDVVLMSEMIEHLVDTDQALSEARRTLVPGGTLVCSTPNLAAWYNRVLLAAGVQPAFTEVSLKGIYGRPGHEVVGHLRIFTKRALVGLLEANGFGEVTVSGAPYHDVPRGFKGLDRLLCGLPSMASILMAKARKTG
ncbi:MAG TPA: class I SAM-dependent methyltransferase [Acidimicrobiales bacterium]|nr:class I SAM-dependent methyltransferase [Acidimicrobiales bacterium]